MINLLIGIGVLYLVSLVTEEQIIATFYTLSSFLLLGWLLSLFS